MTQHNVIIGLSNPKSPENVGSVLRAAGNYRVEQVLYTGQRYQRALENNPDIPNVSRKVSESVSLSAVNSLVDTLPEGMAIVCVEFAVGANSLPEYKHPEDACYIFGPEDGNISQEIIDKADSVVYIPTVGSMNLAATVNVVLYDRLSKLPQSYENSELIRNSRDTNNNLKVR